MDRSPLQHERERRGWTQDHVAGQLRRLGLERGHQNLGIDANAVSRHEPESSRCRATPTRPSTPGHALRLVGQAQERLPRAVPPTVRAWTATVEAVAHAGIGDTDATLAAFKRAEDAIGQGHEPLWPWLLPFDRAKFAGYLGASATKLHLSRTAIPALEEALPGARAKQRALVLVDLAANHRGLGDVDRARSLADEARRIGVEFDSEKVLRRVRQAA